MVCHLSHVQNAALCLVSENAIHAHWHVELRLEDE